ncbi:MAG: polysaccharide deacetylase family protein [Armatimonadetes bacterium]|nr:polysaccharide deacetylase family protein [Armatimonadota bacterium]
MARTRGIVSLTYDGTQLCHVETALPDLQRAGLTATFYAEPATLLDHYPTWKQAQAAGHEIGNGSLIGAALPDGSLPAWTTEMILDDLSEADDLLDELFPMQGEDSIALPFGNPQCADRADYVPELQSRYSVIRLGETGVNAAALSSANSLKVIDPSDLNGNQLAQIARQTVQNPTWIVFGFDGIGSGRRSIDHAAHVQLLDFLAQNADLVEILPVIRAAQMLNRQGQTAKLV